MPPKFAIDVVTARDRSTPTVNEIQGALKRAGIPKRMHGVYVELSPSVPHVPGQGSLSFHNGWDINVVENSASTSLGTLEIRLEGLTVGDSYTLVMLTYPPNTQNAQFSVSWGTSNNAPIPANPQTQPLSVQTLVLPFTAIDDVETVRVRVIPQGPGIWWFLKATLYT